VKPCNYPIQSDACLQTSKIFVAPFPLFCYKKAQGRILLLKLIRFTGSNLDFIESLVWVLMGRTLFLWRRLPPKKKIVSLCPPCLCGEKFILFRPTDIALADGALMDSEGSVILQVAEWLGIPARDAYKIMVGAAQAVGFRTDVKLNRIAEELRRSLQIGCKV
jgi:hypothetical protein